jgi:hypothetical protein
MDGELRVDEDGMGIWGPKRRGSLRCVVTPMNSPSETIRDSFAFMLRLSTFGLTMLGYGASCHEMQVRHDLNHDIRTRVQD